MSDNWKSIVASLAPTVATVLGGPMAGMGVSVLSKMVLGRESSGNEKSDLAEIGKAILTGGTETLQKVKDAETEILRIETEAGIKLAQIGADDRDSARKREIAVKDKTPSILAVMIFTMFAAVLAALIFIEIPKQSLSPLNIMLGSLGTLVMMIAAYYFGSSSGSSKKNFMISGMMQKLKGTAGKF